MAANSSGVVTIEPDQDRLRAIQGPRPLKSKKDAQSLYGFLNCMKAWLPDLSTQTKALRELTKKGVTFDWSEDAEK